MAIALMRNGRDDLPPNADSGGRYEWDWVNTGDQEYIDGELRTLTESYIVRRPDRSIHCFTSRYKAGYERALAIAAAMNQASPNDSLETPDGAE
jgi:hypothetical protein